MVQSQIRLEIVQIAPDLLARKPMLARQAPSPEPRRLRPRLFSTATQLITTGRRRILRPARRRPWSSVM